MEKGTGREARDAVQVFDIPIPTFGKTGTANRFTNSSFIGFLPGSDEETGQLEMEKGYVIASYVGYDDNRPMKGEYLAIYGASGAMPIWIDTANAIANSEDYRNNLQPADLAFNPLPNFLISQGGFVNLPISAVTGLPLSPSAKPASASSLHSIMGEAEDRGDTWRLKRRFEPLEGEKQ
jgi:membrane peptidoglycan carboxypeptidase